jgi:hypothetical protein
VLEAVHGDAPRYELDAFQPEASALLVGGGSLQLDLAARAEDAMPGERVRRIGAQQAGYGAVIARVSGSGGDSTIGAYLARGDGEDHTTEGEVALLVRTDGIAEKVAFAALEEELVRA